MWRVGWLVMVAALVSTSGRSDAFCGFYVAGSGEKLTNDATQVSILRDGTRVALTMSNAYHGPPADFAMVVPVPVVVRKEDVETLPPAIFQRLDAISAPRLVEYWELDPCVMPKHDDAIADLFTSAEPRAKQDAAANGVKIEAQFAVAEYEVVVLSASESNGLETWLRDHRYRIPPGAAEALAPYVRSQMKFIVAKVDIKKVHRDASGAVQLSPLRVTYEADEVRLPVRLGLLNAAGKQDLIVYVLDPVSRYEVANYPNVLIPTDLDVVDAVKRSFASFYAALFDATLAAHHGTAVVTEYAWKTASCDPCPTPPLTLSELAVLGSSDQRPANWVLTRLHARYDRAHLSDDLVLRATTPEVGGIGWKHDRPYPPGLLKQLGNRFQARYVVRHPWTGAIACGAPHRGRWGGPPAGPRPPTIAQGLARAPRGKVSLRDLVVTPVATLGITGR